jgi:hypothetical protein
VVWTAQLATLEVPEWLIVTLISADFTASRRSAKHQVRRLMHHSSDPSKTSHKKDAIEMSPFAISSANDWFDLGRIPRRAVAAVRSRLKLWQQLFRLRLSISRITAERQKDIPIN